jgi:hypothetical protein
MILKELGCEDERWMALAQYRVQCRTVLAVFNFRVLPPPLCSLWPMGRLKTRKIN